MPDSPLAMIDAHSIGIGSKHVPLLRSAALEYLASCPSLPLPGRGLTLERWRALASLGSCDLALAKVLEAHFDAQAILADLGGSAPNPGELWAVWAAEPPGVVTSFIASEGERGCLSGQKTWCSGAQMVTHALVTATQGVDRVLCRLAMDQRQIAHDDSAWQAVGMARVVSGTISVERAAAQRLGAPNAYLDRPGFWHGGAGVAACWFGAAVAIAERLRRDRKSASNPHASAHLGAIDLDLSAAAALLRETAALIDAQPTQSHRHEVTRVRALVDRVANEVIERVGRALGAGPLCTEHDHAQRCADLSTFLRQSHAEADEQALGMALAHQKDAAWML